MQLDVKDAAAIFDVSEKTIYRWIKQRNLPAYRVNEQYRFNRAELLEWATGRKVNVSAEILHENGTEEAPPPLLYDALKNGGICYRVEGADKGSVLRGVVDLMRLPQEVDRDFLYQVLLARESLGSTAIGDGIAIPHVRNPIVLHILEPTITLSFLEHPIDFGALDGLPVSVLFTLVSPTVRAHLHLLSRLAFALRDPGFKAVITQRGSREEIFREVRRIEENVCSSSLTRSHSQSSSSS
jgi:PTS system nitrogen regulatory IIA component